MNADATERSQPEHRVDANRVGKKTLASEAIETQLQ